MFSRIAPVIMMFFTAVINACSEDMYCHLYYMQAVRKIQPCIRRNIWQYRYFEISGYFCMTLLCFILSEKQGQNNRYGKKSTGICAVFKNKEIYTRRFPQIKIVAETFVCIRSVFYNFVPLKKSIIYMIIKKRG